MASDADGTLYPTALESRVSALASQAWVITYVGEHGGGGGGAWTPTNRVVTNATATVQETDYLIWMDSETHGGEQTLTLPNMAVAAQTIVVRHLGGDYPATIQRVTATTTNTYQLFGDGAAVAIDWLGAQTNWYWRQAY